MTIEHTTQPPADPAQSESAGSASNQDRHQDRSQREAELVAAPFAVVHVDSSGIHPSTARMVALTIVLLSPTGDVVETFYQVFDSESDIGPQHLHGLTPADIADQPSFGKTLRQVNGLLDGRTLIMHNMPRTWGFVYAESKLALRNAQKRARNRTRNRRGRRRVGRVARPALLVDTLASARRAGLPLTDSRVRAVATELGVSELSAVASVERAQRPAQEVSVETAQLIGKIFFRLREHAAEYQPNNLKADRFGLQRSITRVEAMDTPSAFENPGVYEPGTRLVQGMEFVVSPDIEMDPDSVIAAGVAKGLSYGEKVTRQSSVVVCNMTSILRGKAMHADRKHIPLIDDATFLELLADVAPGVSVTKQAAPTRTASPVTVQKPKPRGRRRSSRSNKPNRAGQTNRAPQQEA
ncbi:DNA polymerase III subunit epsilon [Corynebacterium epidermidicanis]|uniref:Uncharacterized protein n=1 Tax=Corynebacterium epidermidicanis TaxID=1050174 RepID=A0A0G3GLZ5_9CORY|nr:DNA polymerase III subunit epsilon [Corynebacterium epidermidicanis]AKK02134.1 hypothetical protein CEPID_01235 [Corynebacterium epidermidicanis]